MQIVAKLRELDSFSLGALAATSGLVLSGAAYVCAHYPLETAKLGGTLVVAYAGIYGVGYLLHKALHLPAARQAASVEEALDKVSTSMLVLNQSVDGEYDATVCVIQGQETNIFPVASGTGAEMTERAMEIATREGTRTLCVYCVDEGVTVTYHRPDAGSWHKVVTEKGSAGIGRLRKRAVSFIEDLRDRPVNLQTV